MKTILFPLFCLLAFHLNGQVANGATSVLGNASGSTTWALVIGISDYQDPGIPDLQFAHRDAYAFRDFLRSKGGGSLSEDQIQLLTNENATRANIYMQFDWLVESAKSGDLVLFYFSGHGDVETITKNKNGFLLPHDSPSKAYMAGAINVRDLNDYIATLSEQNGAQVIVVTDACHAGNLAGSRYNGTQATTEVLAKAGKEVRILSCQSDQYSIEGTQWGGGRGAFSYHFVNALYGLADKNEDQIVNLAELDRFLSDNVPVETDPQEQYPVIVGSKTTRLFTVDNTLLKKLQEQLKKGGMVEFSPAGSKGIEEEVLARVDPDTRAQYLAFKTALEEKDLLGADQASANELYLRLVQVQALAPLHSMMRRNLVAALLNESQQVTNNLLENDPVELARVFGRGLYRHIPGYLDRAAELLGERHVIYKQIKGWQTLFTAYNMLTNTPYEELGTLQKREAIPLATTALELAGENALMYDFLGSLYTSVDVNSSAGYFMKATHLSPSYASPYNNLGMLYAQVRNPFLKRKYFKKAIKTDQRYFPAYDNIGSVYKRQGYTKKAEKWYRKSIEVFPNALAYSNLGSTYYEQKRFEDAAAMCLKGIETQPTYFRSYVVLADVYKASRQDEELRDLLVTMETLAKARHGDYSEVALGYLHLKDETAFRSNYYQANAHFEPLPPTFFYTVCSNYAMHGNHGEALVWLELALNRGFHDRKKMRTDDALNSLRKEARFRELKREYRKSFKLTCKDCLWLDLVKEKS